MKLVHLLPVGTIDISLLEFLCAEIPRSLPVACKIFPFEFNPAVAYHTERQQFHSSEILQQMQGLIQPSDWRILAVADVDLYIPILKYVFGEAQIGGPCAVVSVYRLRQEFYGLERDDGLLRQRLLKESVHELGHTVDLSHCQDYRCVMASSHAVEWIDLRESALCDACGYEVESRGVFSDGTEAGVHHKPALP